MTDNDTSRGRSAGRKPAKKRRLSSKRRFSFTWTSSDPVPTSETDSIDYTPFLPSPPSVSEAPRPTSEDIFPLHNRTDRFRPPSPPLLTPKQSAQRYLRVARLALLYRLGHHHPLMTRVRLNGSLKPTAFQTYGGSSPTGNMLQRPRPTSLAEKTRRGAQRRSKLSNEVRGDDQDNSLELSFDELLVSTCSTTQLVEAYIKQAEKEEMERMKAQRKEAKRANAQLEKGIRSLNEILHQSAVLTGEMEEDMMFPMEVGIAI
ncbi:hypothetical protein EPUS_08701 [Endocarpon pusillum Z07020]|uniref:Uncharacterized protein n=1 Tax=Endocarpon pusillum (strain Z07020 / HMAS-L-300199) TaxID=1263415 RepID=U1GL02_ENDPU|nr:uncharacterized protein EPUS_08701 [Endocarpon pusillum Z07020]ERF72893.1 hypothetical protein EPUS_08701 [Endocarpon pusillum Z07020]